MALLLMTVTAWSAQWENGTGEQTILGTSNAALIGFNSYNSIVNPLNNLLATYCNQYLTYTSSASLTVSSGSVMVSNSTASVRLMLINTSSTVLTSANLDTGSLTANTTYYVYATAATNSSTSSTYYISASSTAPSGQTYYYQIGNFTTDANIQITNINNNWNLGSNNQLLGGKSTGVIYQALTDVYVGCWLNASQNVAISIYTGSISGSMTNVQTAGDSNQSLNIYSSVGWPIRKGDFYEFIGTANACYAMATSK